MRKRIGRIGKLVDVKAAGDLAAQTFGDILVVVGVALADIAARDPAVGAERAQMQDLLLRHLVGNHQNQLVAFLAGDQRQSEPGIAGGCSSEEHTSELQSLMRISYAVFCLKKK